ncbi:MAG: hypothetical protein IKC07_04380 [Clostridia bacterium]|nr:hypothetical protein [Clostridia bacterium]
MDLIAVSPKMLSKSIDFNLIKKEEDKDFFGSLFLVAGAIGNDITCENLSSLGDLSKRTAEIIKIVGGEVEERKKSVKARRKAIMQGINISCAGIEEILPFIALLWAFCKGESRLNGVRDTKYISLLKATASEFSHLGIFTEQTSDGLIIHGGQTFAGDGAYVWNSASLAMALLMGAGRSEGEVRIFGIEGICDKRFEDFLKLTIL